MTLLNTSILNMRIIITITPIPHLCLIGIPRILNFIRPMSARL